MKYIQRKQKEKLASQWVKQAGLPPEEVTPELLGEQSTKEPGLAGDEVPSGQLPYYEARTDIDSGMVRLPIRFVLIGLSIIALLLVIVSVLLTILVMRS